MIFPRTRRKSDRPAATGYAVIDFETTGLDPTKGAEIIEIGVVLLSATLAFEGHWTTLVRPKSGSGKATKHIHRIKDVDLALAPAWEDVMDDFLHVLHGRVLVAHNIDFERRFIDAYVPAGTTNEDYGVMDTMPIAEALTGRRSLASLAAACSVTYDAHTALDDAAAVAACLARLSKRLTIPADALNHPLVVNIALDPTETVQRNTAQAEPLPHVTEVSLTPGQRVTTTGLTDAQEKRLTQRLASQGVVVAGFAKSKTKVVVFSDDLLNNHAEDCTKKVRQALDAGVPLMPYSVFEASLHAFVQA